MNNKLDLRILEIAGLSAQITALAQTLDRNPRSSQAVRSTRRDLSMVERMLKERGARSIDACLALMRVSRARLVKELFRGG